jgi:hypothetical protein
MTRSVETGSVLTQFSEPTKSEYSPYASLPRELSSFVSQLAKLRFPVNSKRELLEQLGGPEAPLHIGENVVMSSEALMFIPATFFPLANEANLAEKLSDYYSSRALRERSRTLGPEEAQDLAKRFVRENPEVVTAAAEAVRNLNAIDLKKEDDDDLVAANFLKKSRRLLDALAVAISSSNRLRAKAREDLEERQTRPPDKGTQPPGPTPGET